jgi:hypothetical protein
VGGPEHGGEDQGLGEEVSVEHRRWKVSPRRGARLFGSEVLSTDIEAHYVTLQLVGNNGHRRNRHRSKPLHVLLSEGELSHYLALPLLPASPI